MRIVLDANVLVSGIFWAGVPSQLLQRWLAGRLEIIASVEIVAEYERVLYEVAGPRGRNDLAQRWVGLIAEYVTLIDVRPKVKLCRDPDDDKYLDCAMQGGAAYLVSGDKDLLSLGDASGTPILTAKQFLATFPEE